MMFHWCSKKMWIQLQCDEGHESTCRWAGNVMTTMAMTGATERTGMTGVTERNGGSWNLSESRRTGENLRIPKPFKKIGGWLLHNVCSITPRLMMDNSLFSECFFFDVFFLIYLHFTNYVWNAFGNLMNSLWCQILPHKMPRTWLMWGDAKPPAARKAQTPTKTLQQPGNPKKWHVPCCC